MNRASLDGPGETAGVGSGRTPAVPAPHGAGGPPDEFEPAVVEALRDAFAPPARAPRLPTETAVVDEPARKSGLRQRGAGGPVGGSVGGAGVFDRPVRSAVAAVLLLGLSIGVYLAHRPPLLQAAEVYQTSMADFQPYVICDTPEKFSWYVESSLGGVVSVAPEPGVELIGWDSIPPIWSGVTPGSQRNARVLLARVDGEPVVVFVSVPGAARLNPGDGVRIVNEVRAGGLVWRELSRNSGATADGAGLLQRLNLEG